MVHGGALAGWAVLPALRLSQYPALLLPAEQGGDGGRHRHRHHARGSFARRRVRREDRIRRKCLIGVVVTLVYKPRRSYFLGRLNLTADFEDGTVEGRINRILGATARCIGFHGPA